MTPRKNEDTTPAASSFSTSVPAPAPQEALLALPTVISLPLLLRQPLAEPDWIVPGLLPVGVSLLAGPVSVNKALLANQLGLNVASGTPFLHRYPVCQGRVLYLALAESSVQVRGRALNLLNQQRSPEAFHLAFQWSPFRQGGLADLEDTIASLEGLRLVIIDPLEFVQPLRHESSVASRWRQASFSETALSFFVPLREIAARYKLALLLLHHLVDERAHHQRDPLAGLSPTGLTAASACNLLMSPRADAQRCELHLAGVHVAERRLHLVYDSARSEWKEEAV